MRKLSVRRDRRTWKVRLSGVAFVLLSVSCALFFPSFRSSAETSPGMSEDQWLMSIYQKGKDAYDRGNYQAATAEWDKLGGVLDRYPAFKTVIDYLRGRAKSIAPDDAEEVDRKLDDRNHRLKEVFQKGKEFYDQGSFDKAVAEWDKLSSYLPEDAPDRQVLADLKKYHAESIHIKPATKKSASAVVMNPEDSAEMRAFLESATEEFKKKTEQAKASTGSPDLADQNAVKDAFEKAKWLYFQGNTEDAIAELEKVSAFFAPNAPERRVIEKMALAYRQSLDIQKEAGEALAKKEVKYGEPEGFSAFIEQAKEKFAAQIKESDVQRQAAEKISADRRSWSAEDIQKGRKLFEEGKTDEAVQLWEKAAGNFENEASLRERIQDLKSSQGDVLKAQQAAKDAEARKDAKFPEPEEFTKILNDNRAQIKTQTDSVLARKTKAEQEAVDKRAFVADGFKKGKDLFDEGRFEEALKEWSTLLPSLQDESQLKPLIDEAMKESQNLLLARKAAEEAEARKDLKLGVPEGLEKLLGGQIQRSKDKTNASNEQRRAAEKHLVDRQNVINNTFEKGKALFDEGRFSEAVKEWNAITPEIEDAEKLKSQMQTLDMAYQGSTTAQKSAEEAEAKKDAKLAIPAELSKALVDLNLKIKSQIESAAVRKQAAEKALADKQTTVDAIFAKGKLAADQGKLPEALNIWLEMLPDLDEGSRLKESLQDLNALYENSVKAQQSVKDAEARKDAKLPMPIELVKLLSDISAQAKIQSQLADSQQKKAAQALEDRKTLINNTYLKGKSFFEESKFEEALKEWSSIVSAFEEEGKLKPLLEDASQDAQNLSMTRRAAEEAEQKKDASLKAPEALGALLADVGTKLKVQIVEAQNAKKRSDDYLMSRQQQTDETVQKGNAYFEQDKWNEAKETWLSVLPLLEDPISFQNTVTELEKVHQERQAALRVLDEADHWKDVKLKIPTDISKELAESRERLLGQAHEAELAKQKAEQSLAERQAQVQQAFDRGKAFYWDGKIAGAVQEWASITPYLEDSEAKTSIQSLAASYDNLLRLQQEAQGAELRKDSKLKTPEELPKLLGDARQIIASQTEYAETQKKLADQTFVDRQSLINSTFQKGKTLYEEDRIPEALEEWATITPYLEKGSQLRAFIDQVAKNYENSQVAKKVAEEAEVKKSIKFRTPEDLSKLLDEASQKLSAQVEDSKMQKEVAEKTKADRQAFIDGNFQRGKLLYESGDISGAVDAWTSLIPYIEDDAKIRQLILKVEENRRALQEASAGETMPVEQKKIDLPGDFEKMLVESNQALEKKTGEKGRAKLEEDVRQVIQDKKAGARKAAGKKTTAKSSAPIPMDEIEQMMIEYNIATPNEIEKRHQELKAVK